MLFSRVYNWIKYKTLPPSTLFLNRLVVERDSKHRRILSNLGLTFRNSKWSSYARTNVQDGSTGHLYSFFVVCASFIGILSTLYYTFSYYTFTTVINYVLIPLWFLSDLELYTSSFYIFIAWIALDQITTLTYSISCLPYLTSRLNTTKYKLRDCTANTHIPKRFYKSIIYKWSATSTHPTLNVFESTLQSNQSFYQRFYKTLYKLVKVFSQDKNTLLRYKRAVHSCTQESTLMFNETSILSKLVPQTHTIAYNTLLFDYKVQNSMRNCKSATHEFHLWTLDQLWNERRDGLLSNLVQSFYLSQITYNTTNHLLTRNIEFAFLLKSLESQSNLRSTHKWMYKYNLLHRASLRDPFQLTSFLKHLAPSFYISTFFSRNMWTSSTIKKNFPRHVTLGSYHEALYSYRSLYSMENTLQYHPIFRNLSNFSQLTLFTTSYNWVLQRFYLFNTLPTHIMRWNMNFCGDANRNLQKFKYTSSSWNSNFQWSLNNQRWSYRSPLSAKVYSQESVLIATNLKPLSTLYLNYSEYALFAKLNIEIALNLTTNQGAPMLTFYTLQSLY